MMEINYWCDGVRNENVETYAGGFNYRPKGWLDVWFHAQHWIGGGIGDRKSGLSMMVYVWRENVVSQQHDFGVGFKGQCWYDLIASYPPTTSQRFNSIILSSPLVRFCSCQGKNRQLLVLTLWKEQKQSLSSFEPEFSSKPSQFLSWYFTCW